MPREVDGAGWGFNSEGVRQEADVTVGKLFAERIARRVQVKSSQSLEAVSYWDYRAV